MRKNKSLTSVFAILLIVSFCLFAGNVYAQDEFSEDEFSEDEFSGGGEDFSGGGEDFGGGGEDFGGGGEDLGGGEDFGGGDSSMGDGGSMESQAEVVAPKPKTEEEHLEFIMDKIGGKKDDALFNPLDANKDPFDPLVKKKVIAPPVRVNRPARVNRTPAKPAAPKVKPIQIHVTGIVGNEGHRLAIIKFEGKELTVEKDQIIEGKFKVIDIQNDRVVVYSNKEQRRHAFKIGGEGDTKR